MASPGGTTGSSELNAIDLTDDSGFVSDSGSDVQVDSPSSPIIKQESTEEKVDITDPEPTNNQTEDMLPSLQPDTEPAEQMLSRPEDDEQVIIHDDAQDEQVEASLQTSPKAPSELPDEVDKSDLTIDEVAETQEDTGNVRPPNEDYNVDLVDSVQGASADHHQQQENDFALAEQEPSNTNNVQESVENLEFEPLPDFDASSDLDIDMNDFEALAQFNQNKPDFGDEDLVDDPQEDVIGDNLFLQENPAGVTSEPLGSIIDDNGEVLDWDTMLEEHGAATEELAAVAFAKRKQGYERKKAKGINTPEDDIAFTADEADEHRRLRDVERSQMEMEDPPEQMRPLPGSAEEDSLFVSEVPEFTERQPKKRAAPKPRNRLSKKDVDEALSAGMSAGRGETRTPKRKARAFSEDRQPPKKKRESKKTDGVKKPAQKRGRKPTMSNIGSLGRTNIVAAAQANASKPDMPTFSAKNKEKALKELIASIPSSDRANVTSDRNAIMEATKKFKGIGAMRADGHGGWLLRGMASSLYNHQLLGTAFLRERETGESKPHGGLICDEMGFGKTIQMM